MKVRPTAIVSLVALLIGCAPPDPAEGPIELEVEDIGPAADAELDLSGDEVAKRRSGGTGGQLPGGFPAELPIYRPSTIVDIGDGGLGGYVLFDTTAQAADVESWMRSSLNRAGWSIDADAGGVLTVSRDSRRARVSIVDSGPVTTIRVEY